MKIHILLSILSLVILFSCDPNGKGKGTWELNKMDSTEREKIMPVSDKEKQKTESQQNDSLVQAISEQTQPEVQPHHFICYKSDTNSTLAISISYDENEIALKVKYKGQEESMNLSFVKEDYLEGGAHPTIETYYSEFYNGKENGVYKLIHSGNWDYAEYTRSKDGKKFKFTIDHDLSIDNDGYRTTPCF